MTAWKGRPTTDWRTSVNEELRETKDVRRSSHAAQGRGDRGRGPRRASLRPGPLRRRPRDDADRSRRRPPGRARRRPDAFPRARSRRAIEAVPGQRPPGDADRPRDARRAGGRDRHHRHAGRRVSRSRRAGVRTG